MIAKTTYGLSWRYYRRKMTSGLMLCFCYGSTLVALIPLALIFFYTISKGVTYLNLEFFISMPKPVGEPGGGMANAIVGTLVLIATGSAIGLPVGVFTGIYLAEYGNNKFGAFLRFMTDVLSGVPSIVAGVVAYGLVVIPMKHFSAFAGGVAMAILMVPTVTRTTEEMIRLVPQSYREAGLALGIPQWRTTIQIVVRTAFRGIITGILLSIARIAGETAPLLFTALFSNYWLFRGGFDLMQPTASLAVLIYNFAGMPFENQMDLAWVAALVLVLMVLVTNIIGQAFSRRQIQE